MAEGVALIPIVVEVNSALLETLSKEVKFITTHRSFNRAETIQKGNSEYGKSIATVANVLKELDREILRQLNNSAKQQPNQK
ncbi:unnamed protein product [Orchesella dallaii]|uniref:Uncharacterized protein n=1 Tax=Orchesella dallaii TaxID=48710 RepID=A0ABP1RNP9_9HEXA